MKKIILFFSCVFLLSGCSNNNLNGIINELDNKIENSKNYQLSATLEIYRNEEKFVYDIVSTYKEKDFYKVELINKENNHKQIILKDLESVYVLTPSLNKTFKFQSEWPYNNSQIYLMQPIIIDVKNDKESKFEKNDKGYIITSKVNYTAEKDFKKQKIYLDDQKNIEKIEILNEKNEVKMLLTVINIQYNVKLESDYFDINKYQNNIQTSEKDKENLSSGVIKDMVYPMYVPTDTYLASKDVVNSNLGERVILTFAGDSKFILIQESLEPNQNVGYVYGDPYLILDTVGSITDYSISWISDGVEYSILSESMDVDELLMVAQSIGVEPVGK